MMSNHRSRPDDDQRPPPRTLGELLRAKFDEEDARDSATSAAAEVDADAAIRTAAAHARVTAKALARTHEQEDRP